jgi:hypothetical protein
MTSASPALQFGIQVRGQRSYTWRIRSGAKNPELFVERENLPPTVHLSLHASGQWHMKVRRRRVHQWPQAGGDHTRLHPCSRDRAAGDVADQQLTRMQDTAAKGRLYCTIIGDLDDKTLVLLDLRADPSLVRRG